jgi:hypothetical protein
VLGKDERGAQAYRGDSKKEGWAADISESDAEHSRGSSQKEQQSVVAVPDATDELSAPALIVGDQRANPQLDARLFL